VELIWLKCEEKLKGGFYVDPEAKLLFTNKDYFDGKEPTKGVNPDELLMAMLYKEAS
jgi:hypothetical protein